MLKEIETLKDHSDLSTLTPCADKARTRWVPTHPLAPVTTNIASAEAGHVVGRDMHVGRNVAGSAFAHHIFEAIQSCSALPIFVLAISSKFLLEINFCGLQLL
jgi:hypothetical protein